MGCQISNNLVAPDPITLPPPPDARNRGFLQSSTKTTSPSETSLRNVVNINDILIDKTVRHTFADYVRHEKELIEEEVRKFDIMFLMMLIANYPFLLSTPTVE